MLSHWTVRMIAALVALSAASAFAVNGRDSVGELQRCYGGVQIERSGTRLHAGSGAILYRGDRVVTDVDASAEIRLRGAAPLRIGANADVAVDRLAKDEKPGSTRSLPTWLQGVASIFTGFSRHR